MTKGLLTCCNIFKAVFARLLLCACVFATAWRAATVQKDTVRLSGPTRSDGSFDPDFLMTWLPCAGVILFIPELILTMVLNKGHEFKWWWPPTAIFLVSNIPNIWIIELDIYATTTNGSFTGWRGDRLAMIGDFTLPLVFTPPNWARVLEQISFLVLIIVKWLSPRGLISHEKLSQVLLWFIAIASDILDLMDNLHDELLQYSKTIVFVVLVCYTTSHAQFTFNYTAKRKYKLRWTSDETDLTPSVKYKRRFKYAVCCCFESELWVMFATIITMDGMFFALRMYLFLGLHVVTFGNIFFATKNGVIVAIDIYRIISIFTQMRKESREQLDERKRRDEVDDAIDDDDDEIDEDRIVDMHLIVESDGVIMASARTLREQDSSERLLVRKKKTWELNAITPQWAKRAKKGKNQVVVPGAELHLVYELEFVFDHPGNDDNNDNRVFRCIKNISLRDAINTGAKSMKPNRPLSGSSARIGPMEVCEDV